MVRATLPNSSIKRSSKHPIVFQILVFRAFLLHSFVDGECGAPGAWGILAWRGGSILEICPSPLGDASRASWPYGPGSVLDCLFRYFAQLYDRCLRHGNNVLRNGIGRALDISINWTLPTRDYGLELMLLWEKTTTLIKHDIIRTLDISISCTLDYELEMMLLWDKATTFREKNYIHRELDI